MIATIYFNAQVCSIKLEIKILNDDDDDKIYCKKYILNIFLNITLYTQRITTKLKIRIKFRFNCVNIKDSINSLLY